MSNRSSHTWYCDLFKKLTVFEFIFQNDDAEPHQPNKRIALDSTDLNNANIIFSAVPKSEVMNTLQQIQPSNTVSLATMGPHSSSTIAPFSTLRLVTPSSFVNPNEISTSK
jgi:hypothetical protein